MSKIVKKLAKLTNKKTKKELEEELALNDQVEDAVLEAQANPVAVDTSSLPHFADATGGVGAAGASLLGSEGAAAGAAAGIAGLSTGTMVGIGALAVGGIAIAAGGGGGSWSNVPTDTTAPVFTSLPTATPIAENSGAGQVVYTAVATDNVGVTSYTLSGTDAGLFTIDSAGKVKLTANPDFETKSSYSFDVIAKDVANNATTQAVSLTVTNIDERPRTGYTTTNLGGGDDEAWGIQLDSSGNIYLGGASNASGTYDFAVAKYTSNGELDTSFGGGDGMITTNLGGGDDKAYSLQLDSSGNIYLSGWSNASGNNDFAVAKYTSNGELDTSFGGGDGMITTDFGGDNDEAVGLQLDSSGNIYLGGYSDASGTYDFAVAKYTSNGELDTSFGGGDGMITTDFGGRDEAYSLQLDSSGNIYLGGWSNASGNNDFAVAKYTSNGELDTSFGGGDGMITTDFGGHDEAVGLQLDSSGNIYLGGYSNASGTYDFAVAKYTSNGELDTSFGGGDGMLTTDFGAVNIALDLQLDSSGNIYLGGASNASGTYDFAVAKYTSNGELDTSFSGGDGMITTDFGADNAAWRIQLDSSGNIYLGGFSSDVSGNYDFAVAKYTSNGELDTSFGNLAVIAG